jgi:hypothetical protein
MWCEEICLEMYLTQDTVLLESLLLPAVTSLWEQLSKYRSWNSEDAFSILRILKVRLDTNNIRIYKVTLLLASSQIM